MLRIPSDANAQYFQPLTNGIPTAVSGRFASIYVPPGASNLTITVSDFLVFDYYAPILPPAPDLCNVAVTTNTLPGSWFDFPWGTSPVNPTLTISEPASATYLLDAVPIGCVENPECGFDVASYSALATYIPPVWWTIPLGSVSIGKSSSSTGWWLSGGNPAITVANARISGPDASDFEVSPDFTGVQLTNGPNYFAVTFRPSHAGLESADLYISEVPSPPWAAGLIHLTGTGIVPPTVAGCADPWLAGMPYGSVSGWSQAYDVAPAESPVEMSDVNMPSRGVLVFRASGLEANGPPPGYGGSGQPYGPDGNLTNIVSHFPGAENGIADISAPMNSLVGVFLDDSVPSIFAPPARLDFSTEAARNFVRLTPKLRQPFFIGDGVNSDGKKQQFVVPEGATRLFLGVMDIWGWSDNYGGFNVSVVAIPNLRVNRQGTKVVLSWPVTSTQFVLQSSPTPFAPTSWLEVPAVPVVLGGENYVTNPPTQDNKFFRLRW